jgi:GTP cyclohydrolase IA
MTDSKTNRSIYDVANLLPGPGIDRDAVEESITKMLKAFGEDPERNGLERTPERVARMYEELLSGYRTDPVSMVNDALFEVEYDEMVIVRISSFTACASTICCRSLAGRTLPIFRAGG